MMPDEPRGCTPGSGVHRGDSLCGNEDEIGPIHVAGGQVGLNHDAVHARHRFSLRRGDDHLEIGLGPEPTDLVQRTPARLNMSVGPVTVEAMVPSRAKMVMCFIISLSHRCGGPFAPHRCPFRLFPTYLFHFTIISSLERLQRGNDLRK
jgi:hypothetical protein